jgi:hypothetical protein
MSRSAVSCELFVSAAYFEVVSFPSKPSSRRFPGGAPLKER